MKQWDDKDLDRFLDRALAEFTGEPRTGLEQRVLANLASAQARPRRLWIWAAVPAFAAIVIAALVWTMLPQKPAEPKIAVKAPIAPIVAATTAAGRPPAVRRVAHRTKQMRKTVTEARVAPADPRLPTFPSQTDETQVQLALRFVQNNPALAQQVVKEDKEFQEATARNFGLQDRENGSERQ